MGGDVGGGRGSVERLHLGGGHFRVDLLLLSFLLFLSPSFVGPPSSGVFGSAVQVVVSPESEEIRKSRWDEENSY